MKLLMNPVMNKEFKLRFRSFKSFLGLMFYLIAISVILVGFIFIESAAYGSNYFRPQDSRVMFMVLSYIQLGLVMFVTPGLTAGVISGEREKQTLNILLTTTQTSTEIIIGKLLSSISYLLLMIVASMPIYSIVFLFGGISPLQVLTVLGYYIIIILVFGSFGVLFSTLIRRTIISMITTYGTALFFAGGTAFLFVVSMQFGGLGPGSSPVPYFFAILNPFIVLMGFLEPSIIDELNRQTGILFPVWAGQLIVYGLLFFAALAVSIKKLRPKA